MDFSFRFSFEKEKTKELYQKTVAILAHPSFFLSALLATSIVVTTFFAVKNSQLKQQIHLLQTEIKKETEKEPEQEEQEKGLSYLILKEPPTKYNNLEIIAEHYPKAKHYIPLVQKAVDECKDIWPIDEVLGLGLISHESSFNRYAVSQKGASGAFQLMPSTAKELGMKVYKPDYFTKARKLDSDALHYKKLLNSELAKKNTDYKLVENYNEIYKEKSAEAAKLYLKYKVDLAELAKLPDEVLVGIHQPFIDSIAGPKALEYFAECLHQAKGDARIALSIYNAGLKPIKKARGIPPFKETVKYQNKITNFWKYWSEKAK